MEARIGGKRAEFSGPGKTNAGGFIRVHTCEPEVRPCSC